jgi:hypothetical protein
MRDAGLLTSKARGESRGAITGFDLDKERTEHVDAPAGP